jgi:hypothetical protein
MDKLDEYNEYLKSRFNGVCDFDNALEQYMEKHKHINAELSRIEREKKERTKMQTLAVTTNSEGGGMMCLFEDDKNLGTDRCISNFSVLEAIFEWLSRYIKESDNG